jgi:chromosome segregation ATPase
MTQHRRVKIEEELDDLRPKVTAKDNEINQNLQDQKDKQTRIREMLEDAIANNLDANQTQLQNRLIEQIRAEIAQLQQSTSDLRRDKSALEQQETGLKGKLGSLDDQQQKEQDWVRRAKQRLTKAQAKVDDEELKKLLGVAGVLLMVGAAVGTGGVAAVVFLAVAIIAAVYTHFKHKAQKKGEGRVERLERQIDDHEMAAPAAGM